MPPIFPPPQKAQPKKLPTQKRAPSSAPTAPPSSPTHKRSTSLPPPSTSKSPYKPCKFYFGHNCTRGDKCAFSNIYSLSSSVDPGSQLDTRLLKMMGDIVHSEPEGKTLWNKFCSRPHNCDWQDFRRHKVNVILTFVKEFYPNWASWFARTPWWLQAEQQSACEIFAYQEAENLLLIEWRNDQYNQQDYTTPQQSHPHSAATINRLQNLYQCWAALGSPTQPKQVRSDPNPPIFEIPARTPSPTPFDSNNYQCR